MTDQTDEQETARNVDLQREGSKVVLPEGMDLEEGIDYLELKLEEAEEIVGVHEEIEAFPWDGAHAFMKAMKDKFGWAQMKPERGFFSSEPPRMISVKTGPNDTTEVAWGNFQIPNIEGQLKTEATRDHDGWKFVISGKVKQKDFNEIRELAELTREYLRTDSIYKEKAIRLNFAEDQEHDEVAITEPSFIDLSEVNEDDLIFKEDLKKQIDVNLFTPIEKSEMCKDNGVPVKRGILLEGNYGTGKTMTAYVAAQKCKENGRTFIYLRDVRHLEKALDFASQYEPACIFAEDIDLAMQDDEQNAEQIGNAIDSIESKDRDVLLVLTTNYIQEIKSKMLRPGRLDSIISVTPPDAEAAKKLVQTYGRDLIEEGTDLEEIGELLAGNIPAIIRESVERAKLAAINRLDDGEELTLTDDDLKTAATGLQTQAELINTVSEEGQQATERFADQAENGEPELASAGVGGTQ